jgi:hypothetical protein
MRPGIRSPAREDLAGVTANEAFLRSAPKLLKANTRHRNVFRRADVVGKLQSFDRATQEWANYPETVPALDGWIDNRYGTGWGNLHRTHAVVVDACRELRPSSVCEIGAGAGVVAKYVYASLTPPPTLVCVEGASSHIEQMRANFRPSAPIPPCIDVDATIVQTAAQSSSIR